MIRALHGILTILRKEAKKRKRMPVQWINSETRKADTDMKSLPVSIFTSLVPPPSISPSFTSRPPPSPSLSILLLSFVAFSIRDHDYILGSQAPLPEFTPLRVMGTEGSDKRIVF